MRSFASGTTKVWLAVTAVCLWGGLLVGGACAGETAARGREVVSKWEKAVITVRLTMKMRMSAEGRQVQEEEQTQEIRATVVDPSGLAVCSLAEADPAQMFASMMESEEGGYKYEVDITAVKMRPADGKEIAAKVVLRDKDLDLAFIRPTEKLAQPLAAVDLSDASKVEMLDDVLVIGRLGEAANRVASATLDQIQAVMQKPRLLYVPGFNGMSSDMGCPVFTLDGKIVGILLNRIVSAGGSNMMEDDSGWMIVVLPAADVLEVAKQAPEAAQ